MHASLRGKYLDVNFANWRTYAKYNGQSSAINVSYFPHLLYRFEGATVLMKNDFFADTGIWDVGAKPGKFEHQDSFLGGTDEQRDATEAE